MSDYMILVTVGFIAGSVMFVHFWWTSGSQPTSASRGNDVQINNFYDREIPLDLGSESVLNDWMKITDSRTFLEYCYTETWDERYTNNEWTGAYKKMTGDWYETPIQAYGKTSSIAPSATSKIEPVGVTGSVPNPYYRPTDMDAVIRSFSW